MRIDTLQCGCAVAVPEDIEQGTEDMSDYLRGAGYVRDIQVAVSQWDSICSQCYTTLDQDI